MLSISMREVGVSGRADADVLTRMSRATRSGCSSARSSAIRPPIEIPSTVACDMPTDSMSASVSSAIIGIVYGASGVSVRPAPRLSKASTWLGLRAPVREPPPLRDVTGESTDHHERLP